MTREEKLQQFAEQTTKGLYLDRHNLIQMVKAGAEWADQHPHWIPVEETNNTINVFFRKEQDGWHTYTQYGIDLPTCTAIEFGEHIAKAVNLLNGKGVTNE